MDPHLPSFLHILEVCVLSLTKRQPLPPSSSGCTCMPVHETPLLHTHTHTHVLPALSVTCEDRNSSRLRFGVCADTKNSTEGRRGDSVLAGSPAPRAKIGSVRWKIAVNERRGGGGGGWGRGLFYRLFTFSCSAASARCHMQLSLQLKKDIIVFEVRKRGKEWLVVKWQIHNIQYKYIQDTVAALTLP